MENAEILMRNQAATEYSQRCEVRRFWSRFTRYALAVSSFVFALTMAAAALISF